MKNIYNILTNKFFIIAFLFIAILFSFVSNCFATDFTSSGGTTISVPDVSSILNDTYPNYFIASHYRYTDEIWLITFSNTRSPFLTSSGGAVNFYNGRKYKFSNNTWDFRESTDGLFSFEFGEIFYTSSDIYNSDETSVVFQGAPAQGEEQQQGETQGIQALTLEQAEQIPQAMTQTLRVVIPVGLAIFGIGLVIFLMRYLILRLM